MFGDIGYLPLDDILPHPVEDIMDTIGEELDDETEKVRPNPRSIQTAKRTFQKLH
jgi:hypothetical protein